MIQVGLISDTHGLLRPEALAALSGSRHLIHAGDVGDPAILATLSAIAPLLVVRGNTDREPWARDWPEVARLELAGRTVLVLHDLAVFGQVDTTGIDAVVCGHSHIPSITRRDHVLVVNPGSAGRRRFRLPVTVGRMLIGADRIDAELIDLSTHWENRSRTRD